MKRDIRLELGLQRWSQTSTTCERSQFWIVIGVWLYFDLRWWSAKNLKTFLEPPSPSVLAFWKFNDFSHTTKDG